MKTARTAASHRRQRRPGRTAFTLVEMLVTITVTLIVMLALVTVFEWIGGRVATGRAVIEMSGELRSAAIRLQNDLDSITVQVRPFPRVEQGDGYFHYREGPDWDGTSTIINGATSTAGGDTDDTLAFTARNDVEQFTGKYTEPGGSTVRVNSPEAEIVWWPQFVDLNDDGALTPDETVTRVLHRRVLLIQPDLNTGNSGEWFVMPSKFVAGMTAYNVTNQGHLQLLAQHMRYLYNEYDVSLRFVRQQVGNNLQIYVAANSLADLTRPVNRFLRHPMVWRVGNSYQLAPAPSLPYAIDTNPVSETRLELIPFNGNRRGEDVILAPVLAFDVRVYDPLAVSANGGAVSLVPTDNGWTPQLAVNSPNGRGCFVDLFYRRHNPALWLANMFPMGTQPPISFYSDAPQTKSNITAANEQPFYDTWSFHFEQNGIDDDGDSVIDEGTDGIDNDSSNGTDDPGERETSPPYPVPLRGIQTVIRTYEPDTRQVRQARVSTDFVPE